MSEMLKHKTIFILLCLLFKILYTSNCYSQTIDSILLPPESKNFGIAPNGDIYIQTINTLYKYSSDTTLLCSYTNKNYGIISHSDLSNTLKLLLYFENFNSVVILDSYLKEIIKPINLNIINTSNISFIVVTDASVFYIYDDNNSTIKKISNTLEVISESLDISKINFNSSNPLSMRIMKDNVLLTFQNQILLFDINLNYVKSFNLTNKPDYFILNNEDIIYSDTSGTLIVENLITGRCRKIKLKVSTVIQQVLQKENLLYLMTCHNLYRIVF